MQRISAIGLLLIFLTAQVGLTFGTHYCQGEAVHTTILWSSSEVPGCGMEEVRENCDNERRSVLQKHCCDEDRVTLRNERDPIPSVAQRIEAPVKVLSGMERFPKPALLAERSSLSGDRERTPPLRDDLRSPSRAYSVQHQVFRL